MSNNSLIDKLLMSSPVNKEEFIKHKCTGKKVLDLGCIRHSADFAIKDPDWLHGQIKSVASSVIGIDYLENDILKLNNMNYDIRYGDVTKPINIDEEFDVIVAGDLIEHLVNFEGFFENCNRLLKSDGIVIVTTPNPFYSAEYHYVSFKQNYLINPEHTCWIDPKALSQLVSRFDMLIDEMFFIQDSWKLSGLVLNS